jgi:hypothetical protein
LDACEKLGIYVPAQFVEGGVYIDGERVEGGVVEEVQGEWLDK